MYGKAAAVLAPEDLSGDFSGFTIFKRLIDWAIFVGVDTAIGVAVVVKVVDLAPQ